MVLGTASLFVSMTAAAVDQPDPAQRLVVRVGRGDDAQAVSLAWQRDWRRVWRPAWSAHGRIGLSTEFAIGRWRADGEAGGASDTATRIGLTPVVRYHVNGSRGWFVEAGIGVNLIEPRFRVRGVRFSTAFNFGDHIGIGWRSAAPRAWHWALRLEHFSNGGVKHPNPGQNFLQTEVGYEF